MGSISIPSGGVANAEANVDSSGAMFPPNGAPVVGSMSTSWTTLASGLV
jgi:hypothetical protein